MLLNKIFNQKTETCSFTNNEHHIWLTLWFHPLNLENEKGVNGKHMDFDQQNKEIAS